MRYLILIVLNVFICSNCTAQKDVTTEQAVDVDYEFLKQFMKCSSFRSQKDEIIYFETEIINNEFQLTTIKGVHSDELYKALRETLMTCMDPSKFSSDKKYKYILVRWELDGPKKPDLLAFRNIYNIDTNTYEIFNSYRRAVR